jgi:hypothetical protein
MFASVFLLFPSATIMAYPRQQMLLQPRFQNKIHEAKGQPINN